MKTEVLHKEIDLIQGVITRMASNSFLLKGWLITLIAVMLTLSKDSLIGQNGAYFSLVAILPVSVFWYLDAFFLHRERCFRKLYEWVILHRQNSDEFLYSLDCTRFKREIDGQLRTMFSRTLFPFYGLTILGLAAITIVMRVS